jgi:hypothetical protein
MATPQAAGERRSGRQSATLGLVHQTLRKNLENNSDRHC